MLIGCDVLTRVFLDQIFLFLFFCSFSDAPERTCRAFWDRDDSWYIAYVDGFDKTSKRIHIRYKGCSETEWLWPTRDKCVAFDVKDFDDDEDEQNSPLPENSNQKREIIPPKYLKSYYESIDKVCEISNSTISPCHQFVCFAKFFVCGG